MCHVTEEPEVKSRQSARFEDRFINFSISIIKLVTENRAVPRSVADQVIQSVTAIGANYAEVQNAVSRADFKNKIGISKKEAAETRYWLRIIEKLTDSELLFPYLKESQEVLFILQKNVSTLRTKSATCYMSHIFLFNSGSVQ